MQATSRRIRLFDPPFEAISLALPFLFFPLIALELIFFWQFTSGDREMVRFIESTVFLNGIHIAFSYAMLWALPGVRTCIDHHTEGEPWKFWGTVQVAVAFFAVLTLIQLGFFAVGKVGGLIVFALFQYLSTQHPISQMKGISLAYSHKSDGARAGGGARKWERLGFDILAFLLPGWAVLWVAFQRSGIDLPSATAFAFAGVVLIPVAMIFANCLRAPAVSRSNKVLFLARLLVLPFWPFSVMAVMAVNACHGVEYMGVTAKMFKESEIDRAQRRRFLAVLAVLSSLVLGLVILQPVDGLISLYFGGFEKVPVFFILLNSLWTGCIFAHYFIDRKIFRMRYEANVKHVLPLLLGNCHD